MMKKLHLLLVLAMLAISNMTAYAQTGYFQNFSGTTLPTEFTSSTPYTLSVENQTLKAIVGKSSFFNGLDFNFPAPLDISANPTLSFKIKTSGNKGVDIRLTAFLFNSAGTKQTGIVGTLSPKVRISDEFQMMSLRFKNAPADLTKITQMQILFNPTADLNGLIYLDDISLGNGSTPAVAMPYVTTYGAQNIPLGGAPRVLRFIDVIDGTTQTNNISFSATSSNTTLIPNSGLTFNNPSVSNGGASWLKITPAANQVGTSNITITLSAANAQPYSFIVPVTVSPNKIPTTSEVTTQFASSGTANSILLTGITDGNTEAEQSITITATSDNQTSIPNANISVVYTNNQPFATINYTPTSFSSLPLRAANIVVTVKDNGGVALGGVDTKTINIPVTIYPIYYKSPTIDAVTANYNFTPINAGNQSITLTGITDGNGGTNIASFTATSSNTAVTANPVINYTAGSNTAILNYNAIGKGISTITVKITNSNAPANSNGTSSKEITFTVGGIDPQYTGYVEDFSPSIIYGEDYYVGQKNPPFNKWLTKIDSLPGKWYIEGQGSIQTLTLEGGKAIIKQNKPASIPQTFCGIWFSPRRLFDLSKNKYLSITVSATPSVGVTFDIFDVNGKRYGLLPEQFVRPTESTFLFNFDKVPSSTDFDFTKIASILINTIAFKSYNGTITISALKIGDQADNAPVFVNPTVKMDLIGPRFLSPNSGPQTLKITGLADGSLGNSNAVTLQATTDNTAKITNLSVSSVTNGEATLSYTVPAGETGTANISVTGSAQGSTSKVSTFAVSIITPNTATPTTITITPSTKHQTIDGFGAFTAGADGDGGLGPKYSRVMKTAVNNLGLTIARNELPPAFELTNDNDDPNVLNLSGFNVNVLPIKKFKEQYALGIRKFITTLWSAPAYMKRNLSPVAVEQFIQDNRLDTNYTAEFAEYIVAYLKIVKQETGIEIFALSLQNELQFNEPYNSTVYNPQEYLNVVKAVGRRFKKEGIKTLLFGPEALPAQPNYFEFLDAINNDAEAREYFNIYAIHNYDVTGTKQGGANSGDWGKILTSARRLPAVAGALPAGHTGNGGTGIRTAQTETSGYFQNWDAAILLSANIHRALVFGNISMWIYWSIESGDESEYGLINGEQYGNSPLMYASKHFYKFIRPDAVRIGAATADSNILVSAYQNAAPDNSTAVVMINNSETVTTTTKVNGLGSGNMYVYRSSKGQNAELIDSTTTGTVILPPYSIVTMVSKKEIISATQEEEQAQLTGKMVVYPNPTQGLINVSLPTGSYTKISVVDMLGRVVMTKSLLAGSSDTYDLNLSGLEKGMYILSVDGDKKLRSTILVD